MNQLSYESSPGDDFRMRYQCFIDDIKYIKSKQWSVTYYLLLLIAAIIGLHSGLASEYSLYRGLDPVVKHYLITSETENLRWLLFLTAVGVGLIGSYFQYDFQHRLQEYRHRNTTQVVSHMSKAFQEYENISSLQGTNCYLSFFNGIQFPLIFILILWVGVSIVYLKLFGYDLKWMGGILVLGPISFFACWLIAKLCKGGD